MSLDLFRKIIYQDLPEQNLAFVEGGVLIYPQMLGMTVPLNMTEEDMYRYLVLFESVMDKMGSAINEKQGQRYLQQVAQELGVNPDKFKKDNINFLMVESLLQGKVLMMDFKTVQSIYNKQKYKARKMIADLEIDIPTSVKSTAKKIPKTIAVSNPSVIEESVVERKSEPPYPSSSQPSLTIFDTNNNNNKTNSLSKDTSPHLGFLAKTTDFVRKPPVVLALISLGLIAYHSLPKKSNDGYQS